MDRWANAHRVELPRTQADHDEGCVMESQEELVERLKRIREENNDAIMAAREWANTRYTTQRSSNHVAQKAFLAGVEWGRNNAR